MTRSGVNAWEMGISKPSLENLVILSRILHTTTDYLLGNNNEETIVINDFTPEEKEMVMRMVHYIEEMHQLKCKKQPSRQIGGLFRSSIRNLFRLINHIKNICKLIFRNFDIIRKFFLRWLCTVLFFR